MDCSGLLFRAVSKQRLILPFLCFVRTTLCFGIQLRGSLGGGTFVFHLSFAV